MIEGSPYVENLLGDAGAKSLASRSGRSLALDEVQQGKRHLRWANCGPVHLVGLYRLFRVAVGVSGAPVAA